MERMTRAEHLDAQRRRMAVRLYRAGVPVTTIAQKLKVPVGSTNGSAIRPIIFGLAFDRRRVHRIVISIRRPLLSSGRLYGCASNWSDTRPALCGLPAWELARFNTSTANAMGRPPARVRFIAFSTTITWWRMLGPNERRIGRIPPPTLRMRCRPPTSSLAGLPVAWSCRPSTRSISTATTSPPRPMPTKPAPRLASTCCKRGKR
jgi:hypothetical protein